MRRPTLALALLTALAPAVARADDKPPKPPTASVYAGSCLSPALSGPKGDQDNDQAAFLAGLLSAVVPKLIGAGLDWVGAKLAQLGADEVTTISGVRTSEAAYGPRYCVQLAHWAPKAGQPLSALAKTGEIAKWPWPAQDKTGVPLDRPLDYFVELWVRTSDSGKAISLTPTLLYHPHPLAQGDNGKTPSSWVLNAKLQPVGTSPSPIIWAPPTPTLATDLQVFLPARQNKDGTWARQRLGDLQRICETACEGASPWVANPWAGAAKAKPAGGGLAPTVGPGAAAEIEQATNISLDVTEVRPGSKFFKVLADAFATAKPDIQSQIQQVVLADARDKAENEATTKSAGALVTFSSKMSEAEGARERYCAAKGKAAGVILGLSAEVSAKQKLANLAAAAAGVATPPYPAPLAPSGTLDAGLCPA